jgi:hypothetical protein
MEVKRMLNNNVYNLMEQMTKESQSLWRIKEHYKKDAAHDENSLAFWEKLEKDKEEHIKDLQNLLKKKME